MAEAAAALLHPQPVHDGRIGLTHPFDASRRIRAVLFDVDGTLYRQAPLRILMALELLTLPLSAPFASRRRWRALAAYRFAQERLRAADGLTVTPAAQLITAAEAAAVPIDEMRQLVDEWMFRRPLKYLPFVRASGVARLLDLLERTGVPAGVLSDYNAEGKLRALGLASRFSLVLCATDAGIGTFKPNPRGFLHACARWGLDPGEVLMVGDRLDVDAAGAIAASMPCVIISRRPCGADGLQSCLVLPSFERLYDVLDRRA